ncbi:hypothetical protein QN277_001277 [Acacia crassicarpa]|uniref:MADS-box domain-containing protein n=1 Tax=Acacia crassicarpa TaxID=499986 RepID=A0AAE1N6U0_9FABA|nr:hypothetical protein QN277_001277 [Acacia crassicarpa]
MSSSSNNGGGGGGGRRRSKGRQKIEIKKMENESNLQVTFSKRRAGLFKKASELCILCGVEVAIIVFSPGEKAYSFGHPSVNAVLDRFLNGGVPPMPPPASMQMVEAHRRAAFQELHAQLTRLLEELEVEKKIGKELNKKMKEMETDIWWAQPVGTLSKDQLGIYKVRLEEIRKIVWRRADQIVAYHIGNNSSQFFEGGSSSSSSAAGFQMPPTPLMMPNMAAPLPAEDQVFPPPPVQPPPVFLQQQPPVVQNPMMFDGNMMMSPQQPMMMSPQAQPHPPPPPAAEGFQQYQNMGESSGEGLF